MGWEVWAWDTVMFGSNVLYSNNIIPIPGGLYGGGLYGRGLYGGYGLW